MRTSRIGHPSGGRFLLIHEWAVRAVGRGAAAVLGALDFLDRGQEQAGCILATRARLIAELEGFVSRDSVDNALATLIDLGWVHRHARSVMGPRNLQTSYEYSLNADAISAFLSDSWLPEKRRPGIRKNGSRKNANQDCNQAAKPDTSTDVLDVDLDLSAVVAATTDTNDKWLTNSTHPLTAAALVQLAEASWHAKPGSNLELDKKHCRQALHAAATLSDAVAAAVVDGVYGRGGWPKDAVANLKSAADKQRHETAYQAQKSQQAARGSIACAAQDERYAWLVGRYVDLPSGIAKIKSNGLYTGNEIKSLPQLLAEVTAGTLHLYDADQGVAMD